MKYLTIIFITIFKLNSCGQIIIYATTDTTDRFSIGTIKVSGDSSFVIVCHLIKGKLVGKEDQLNIRTPIKASTSNCNGDSGKGLTANIIKTLFHGSSEQWYLDGQLKCKGTFTFDKKNSDWKYWNEAGKEILPPDEGADLHIRRGNSEYFIDGVKVYNKKKKQKRRKK